MNPWKERNKEEQRLLNPSFCALLLWNAATGFATEKSRYGRLMPLEEAFLVLSMVLHKETRDALPRSPATSLAVWASENPLARATVADRARVLVPFTKEALLFGGLHDLFEFPPHSVAANADWKGKISSILTQTSDEVRFCVKRAAFLGRWFARSGNAETVLSIIGVRP